MQPKNRILFLLFSTALLFFSQGSFAQFAGMRQVNTNMNNQFMAQQMQMNMNMSMLNNFGSTGRSQNSSRILGKFNEYTYLVKMKDGTDKTVKSYIYIDTTLHKSYLLFVDKSVPKTDTAHRKQKIYVNNTISIGRITEVMGNDTNQTVTQQFFTGMATDSCWLFKVIPGRITLYSFLSEKENTTLFDPSTVIAIQYDNGPVNRLDFDALKNFIAADDKAMKYFNKKDYLGAIKRFNKDADKTSAKTDQ